MISQYGAFFDFDTLDSRWRLALKVLSSVPAPNLFVFNTAIHSCAQAKQWAVYMSIAGSLFYPTC